MRQANLRRRSMLSIILTGGLAGCLGSSDSSGEEPLSFFSDHLENEGIDVDSLELAGDGLKLVYASEEVTGPALGDEIGTIAGGYVRAMDKELNTVRLEATITDGTEDLATWYIRDEWVTEFENGSLSPDEFTSTILGTVEIVEH